MYIISAVVEGEDAWFMGLLPNMKTHVQDVAWTTVRSMATRFVDKRAAEDTAKAIRLGKVEQT